MQTQGTQLTAHSADQGAMAPPLTGEHQFVAALPMIDSLIEQLCRQHHVPGGDDSEFRSRALFKLIDNDYEVLRKFQGKSSLKTYLLVVLRRVLLDYRVQEWGKWRPSVSATRLGPVAIRLEQLLVRDGMPLDEAIRTLRTNHRCDESVETLHAIAAQLRRRPRVRVQSEAEASEVADATPLPDALAERGHAATTVAHLRAGLRQALRALPRDDRLILKLRFVDGLPIVVIASKLQCEPKPLYRRLERILWRIRRHMQIGGVESDAARAAVSMFGA